MNTISDALKDLHIAKPAAHDGLTVYPLLRESPVAKDYLTLDEALARKSAQVTEVSDAGSVPQLLFRNLGELAVFLLDGEELVGAKQNRILNLSILAPARKDTVIPVSCVEAGRWRPVSAEFSSASRAQFAASRAKRAAHVSEDILRGTGRRSDQQEVWRDIDDKLARLGQHSASSAVEAVFVAHEDRLFQHVGKFAPRPRQVGGVFALDGKVVGLELFDSEATCAALLPKIVRSYALDAIDPGCMSPQHAAHQTPEAFLAALREAPVHEAPAIGEGTDVRLEHDSGLAGGALAARGRVVHLVAFVAGCASRQSGGR